ncbi:hypothetical protein CF392_16045 [Tamilnaduibacter salinus]|uniref:Sulfotransferase family protein n=1 Tax=Tamilnaduibacter salinus TaxID=1484056 RepID=A0A2A2I040_9GAMM|nr:sulfotransferase [Tamilnaduibacter salinus]PAV24480.1 hypothetical protein CF392_16045 [Tamilnaduibacter salinus]
MDHYSQLFILGSPRSGTTFLSRLLDKTRYGKPIETHFITKYHKKLHQYGDLSNKSNFNRLMRDILAERPIQQWRLNLDLKDFFDRVSPDFRYSNIVNQLMVYRQGGRDGVSWGDKTPHYIGDAERLFELFPEARYIYIVRDGRDVALSLLKKEWGPSNTVSCAEYWARQNSHPAVQDRLDRGDSIYFLTYEDLLANPAETIRSLYEFLGESVDPDKLDALIEETQAANSFKWRQTMSPRQIRQFESLAGGVLQRFGYPVISTNPRLRFLEKPLFHIHEKVSKWLFFSRRIWLTAH